METKRKYTEQNSVERKCKLCKKEFRVFNSRLKNSSSKRGQFCSLKCNRAYRPSGIRYCKICGNQILNSHYKSTCSRKCMKKYYTNERRFWNWKGDNVGYNALHKWIRNNKPKSEFCNQCNDKLTLIIHNVSGEYRRDFDDWEWICYPCHAKIHEWGNNFKQEVML